MDAFQKRIVFSYIFDFDVLFHVQNRNNYPHQKVFKGDFIDLLETNNNFFLYYLLYLACFLGKAEFLISPFSFFIAKTINTGGRRQTNELGLPFWTTVERTKGNSD